MVGVLVVRVCEALVAGVVGVGRDEHEYSFVLADVESLHPGVPGEVLVEALRGGGGTVMTSKAWVRLW